MVELVYWFIIRFCRLSKKEKRLEKLEIEKAAARQNGSFEQVWCDGWESPCVRNEKDDEYELESSHHLEYFSEDNNDEDNIGMGFLSRASSVCSIKIRHQLTVLKMFFGRQSNN